LLAIFLICCASNEEGKVRFKVSQVGCEIVLLGNLSFCDDWRSTFFFQKGESFRKLNEEGDDPFHGIFKEY
jgi:hypothetical protein